MFKRTHPPGHSRILLNQAGFLDSTWSVIMPPLVRQAVRHGMNAAPDEPPLGGEQAHNYQPDLSTDVRKTPGHDRNQSSSECSKQAAGHLIRGSSKRP